jgi:predicted phage tail protein
LEVKSGVLQTILGAVLVVVGVAIGYFSAGTYLLWGTGLRNWCSDDAGGVVQMLSPQPSGWPANKVQITAHPTHSVV